MYIYIHTYIYIYIYICREVHKYITGIILESNGCMQYNKKGQEGAVKGKKGIVAINFYFYFF